MVSRGHNELSCNNSIGPIALDYSEKQDFYSYHRLVEGNLESYQISQNFYWFSDWYITRATAILVWATWIQWLGCLQILKMLLIHCGLVTPYDDINLSQHWPMLTPHMWGSMAFTGEQFHSCIMSLKSICSELQPQLPGGQWTNNSCIYVLDTCCCHSSPSIVFPAIVIITQPTPTGAHFSQ